MAWPDRERPGVFCHGTVEGRAFALRLPESVPPPARAPGAHFAGRSTELAALVAELTEPTDGTGAPTVVTGPPGVGKSELARRAAAELHAGGRYPGGVLAPVLDGSDPERRVPPGRALDAALRTLGLPPALIPVEVEARAALFRAVLAAYAAQGRRLLVLLDDADDEHLALLLPTPGTAGVLVTARPAPAGPADVLPLAPLPAATGAQLLRETLPGAARGALDDLAARRLAEACGGLPSALLLAARTLERTGTTPGELTELIGGHAAATTDEDAGARVRPAVHAAALRGLTTDRARLLRLLARAPGPGLSTAAVARLIDAPEPAAAADLAALHAAGLIEPGGPAAGWHPVDRESTAASAGEPDDDHEAALSRLLRHQLDAARAAAARLRPGWARPGRGGPEVPDRAAALAWYAAEHRTVIALLHRAVGAADAGAAVELIRLLEPFLDHGRHQDDRAEIAEVAERLAGGETDPATTLRAAVQLGRARCAQGRYEEAVTVLRTTAAAAGSRDQELAALVLDALGATWLGLGRREEAAREGLRAAAFARRAGNRAIEYAAQLTTGIAFAEQGRGRAAVRELGKAVQVAEVDGDQQRAAVAEVRLGLVGLDLMDGATAAAATFVLAFDAFREVGEHRLQAEALGLAGRALLRAGGGESGVEQLCDAARQLADLGDEYAAYRLLAEAGEALRTIDRPAQALVLQQAVAAFQGRIDDPEGRARALTDLGATLSALGRYQEAVDTLTEAVTAARPASPSASGAALAGLGRALHGAGQHREALEPLREAVTLARAEGDPAALVWAATLLGSALTVLGRRSESAAAFRESRAAARRLGRRGPAPRTAVYPAPPAPTALGPGKAVDHGTASRAYTESAALLLVAAAAALWIGGPWSTAAVAVAAVSALTAAVAATAFRRPSTAAVAGSVHLLLQVGWTVLALLIAVLAVVSLVRGELPLPGAARTTTAFACYLLLATRIRRAGRQGAAALAP
ncbi:tetratricopeptide repeat protein [Kitasatospora sp. NPDC094015]|uniref:tetratricopeptide repeat protein n=1 Tax=Kitasatospora sp. NPDC094015 TaxID=3155205 RepID=UPI00332B9EA3